MEERKPRKNALSHIADWLDRILVWFSIFLGALLTINMVTAVFFRYVVNQPIFWADELSLILFAWLTFLGGSLAVKRSSMAAVTIVLDRLPPRFQFILHGIIQLSIVFFTAFIGYFSIQWIRSPSVRNMISPALSVEMWVLYLIVPFGMLFMLIFSIDNINKLIGRELPREEEAYDQ